MSNATCFPTRKSRLPVSDSVVLDHLKLGSLSRVIT